MTPPSDLNPWHESRGRLYRWVSKDGRPDFGEVWYNPTSDLIFIRTVEHEFDERIAQIKENRSIFGCEYVGEL